MKWLPALLALLLPVLSIPQELSPPPDSYPRWAKAQKYADGFDTVDCFAGQARVGGKRLAGQPFSVFVPGAAMKCCGRLIATGRTDRHGHFLVEPMQEGEYFAQFAYKGELYVTNFAVIESYSHCDFSSHIEVSFSNPKKPVLQSFIDMDDTGEPCQEDEPHCYRK